MTARLLRSSFFWLVLILVALEGVASRLLPYGRLRTARVASRNALTKEGWPEYTAGERDRRGKLAVIVSHSQGVGIEIESAARIYAALLRERLRLARPGDSLENWSSPGLRTADLEVLSLRAADRRADLVVLMLGIANLDRRQQINLAFPEGDIPLIAADFSLWPRIPRTLFFERLDARTFVETVSAARSDLVRSRRGLQRLVASLLPPDLQRLLLGREMRQTRRLDALARSGASPAPPLHAGDRRLSANERGTLTVTPSDVNRALRTLRRLYPRLHQSFREQGTRELWVWAPVAIELLPPADRERLRAFHREATRVIEADGGETLDLSEAIPTERFYTRGHYDEEGHRLMSRLLWPVLRDELR